MAATEEVLFPQRPIGGVQTPTLQADGETYTYTSSSSQSHSHQQHHQAITSSSSSYQQQQQQQQQQQVGNEFEVIVLRPSIRPPTYDEVAQSTASPGRFGTVTFTDSTSPASHSRHTNNQHYSSSSTHTAGGRMLPGTSGETPYQNISSMTVSGGSGKTNNTTSTTTTTYYSSSSNTNAGLVRSGGGGGGGSSTTMQTSSYSSSSSAKANQGVSSSSSTAHRQGSPRKLACWNVGTGGGENAIPTLKYRTIGDTVKGCLTSNDHRPLTNQELKVDWKRICALQSGHELYKLRPPYVDREEFADPLQFTSEYRTSGVPTVLIPSGYVTIQRQHPPPGVGKMWDHIPWGQRPTARQNTEVALKPTQIDPLEEKFPLSGSAENNNNSYSSSEQRLLQDNPYHSSNYGGELLKTRHAGDLIPKSGEKVTSRALLEASAVPLNIPPSNPIIEEADRRLQQRGFGGLGQVGRASDEAVSHLLKVCGFPDAQRLVILWEIRKAKRK